MTTYTEFLKNKIRMASLSGLSCADNEINPMLKPHQRDIVRWAVTGGARAIFAQFGLGKTYMQLEICRILLGKVGGRALIVCPLGVRQEFFRDSAALGIDIKFIRHTEDLDDDHALYLTNYESIRDGRLSPNPFGIVSLDEASVLRSYGSKTFQEFLLLFAEARFKFVATATPSPNRYKELIHYAGFLGIMDTGQALTRFFQRNSEKANDMKIYPHKEQEFWIWMHSWAIFLQRPSELGYSDEGYALPDLEVIYHEVKAVDAKHVDKHGQVLLFGDSSMSLAAASREKRESIDARVAKLAEIVETDPTSHYIFWHDLEAERHAIQKAIPDAVSVYGSQDLDAREQRIIDFSDGRFKYLATKPSISGSGCNFQRFCHKAVFLGIGFKFNDFIQSIHRIYRFLQVERCEVHIIYTEAEREVLDILQRKWDEHRRMLAKMSEIVTEYGLAKLSIAALERSLGVERKVAKGHSYTAINNDCVEETMRIPDNSVDLVITSIPFSNHYEYTPSYNDFGHTESNAHFWEQMNYLTPELLRVVNPGRLACIHVKDRILFGNVTGAGIPTVSPFHAEAIFHYRSHGWDYIGMITVVTDVVRENNQTYRLGWTEQCKDGTKMGVGSPEYVLLFRKPQTDRSRGYADIRVVKNKADYTRSRWQVDAHAFWRSSGDRLISAADVMTADPSSAKEAYAQFNTQHVYDYEEHVAIGEALDARDALSSTHMTLEPASHDPSVWTDVNRMRTLNGTQSRRGLQLHICPLQSDIVDRLIRRYSNEGELVYDPFAGLMTVPYRALLLGRRGAGVELSEQSWRDGIKYLELAEVDTRTRSLFDELDEEAS
jgi:DNA modification methylase